MSELVQAFVLGNSAILTNACMLPLYPGMIAFLSSNNQNQKSQKISAWLGFIVLAGILSMMLLIGLLLYLINQSFGVILPFVLPAIYGIVIVLGCMMLWGYNPFARLIMVNAPVVSNPFGTAYLYGLMFGPMTLPCTGPILTTAFLLSVDSTGTFSVGVLASQLLYFLFFGLGFGWPLLLLPMLAIGVQRRFIGLMTKHHELLNRISGTMLIVIGLFGIVTELLPNL